ncbi:hypothetical protein GJAV_G00039140 [Gymnothorax javanicus]|nr:hypothetical protein GJAV_G00039140 [Gymnothorax javanicus]
MRVDSSVTRAPLVLAGISLVVAFALGFLIGVFSELKCREVPDRPNTTCTNANWTILPLNVTSLAEFFHVPSSRSSMFLKASHSDEKTVGHVHWLEVHDSQNAVLEEEGRWIRLEKAGQYLLFVQAVYQLNSTASAGDSQECRDTLELRVLRQYGKGDEEQVSSTFHTLCCGPGGKDITLSHPVLLQAQPGNRISVNASHRHLMDYYSHPISSFLTLLRYSDP